MCVFFFSRIQARFRILFSRPQAHGFVFFFFFYFFFFPSRFPGLSAGLPGVYFHYEVSPVQALVEEKRKGFLSFLTGASGVVGGVYTILGLVNAGINGLLSGKSLHATR